jgi:hypothetical protein
MIPYLWALSIIFIGVGLVLYKMMLPPIDLDYGTVAGMEMNLTDLLLNKTVLISMLVCFIIIIVTVGLKAGGIIGK